MFWLLQLVFFFTVATNISWAQQIMNAPDLPYASNPPRINPPYCVGFKITYPSKYNETPLKWGDIGFLSWQVDKDMKNPPDLITRIRLLDATQRNLQIIGENVTIHTHDNKGGVTFPVYNHDMQGYLGHYRIMVNHPNESVHCVYESVPFAITPRSTERFTNNDTPVPEYSVANARRLLLKKKQ